MSPVFFNPPYDSPLEHEFARNAEKFMQDDVDLITQFPVNTICGQYRIDFLLTQGTRRIGIECDGKEFHDRHRDEWRDAMILGSKAVQVIYRFPGNLLFHHMGDCLFLLMYYEPNLFTDRGKVIIRQLTSERLINDSNWWKSDEYIFIFVYPELKAANGDPASGMVFRRSFATSMFVRDIFGFTKWLGGGDLNTVMDLWAGKNAEYFEAIGQK